LNRQYLFIATLLLVSFGFTSAFAETSPAATIPDEVNIQTSHLLVGRPFSLDQIHVQSPFDFRDNTANILAIFLLAIPFGAIVYRMSDNDPIPIQTVKLSSVVVFFAMASMLAGPIFSGNSMWGYAFASPDSEPHLPKPIDSLSFDPTTKNFSTSGAATILDENKSALYLDGQNDYIVLDKSLPKNLKEFSVSAWVKPDYKKGSGSTQSIVSQANAFDLSINNIKSNKNTAQFSVFDGIRWHSVQSSAAVPNTWTHISATFSENTIKIFVNGQETSKSLKDDYSLTYEYGVATPIPTKYFSSQDDVLVGAFNPSIREDSTTQNYFSGLIDDVTLYNKLLTSDNISTIKDSSRTADAIPVLEFHEISLTEPTGTENYYGFVTDKNNPNDQKTESVASEGYKVEKPKDNKNKPLPEEKPAKETETLIITSSESQTNSSKKTTENEEQPPVNQTVIDTGSESQTNADTNTGKPDKSIIDAKKVLHLDSERNEVLGDITFETEEQDNIWSDEIPVGDYVRAKFAKSLKSENDITIYARSSGDATIEVYEKDGSEPIATFESINDEARQQILLTNLSNPETTFDLKIIGDPVEFDLVTDPAPFSVGYTGVVYRSDQNKWTPGNAGNAYTEGSWVSYVYTIEGKNGPGPFPSFNVVNTHYDSSKQAIFVDAYTNFRYCVDVAGSCTPLPDGTRYPPINDYVKWHSFSPSIINGRYDTGTNTCNPVDPTPLNVPSPFACFRIEATDLAPMFAF